MRAGGRRQGRRRRRGIARPAQGEAAEGRGYRLRRRRASLTAGGQSPKKAFMRRNSSSRSTGSRRRSPEEREITKPIKRGPTKLRADLKRLEGKEEEVRQQAERLRAIANAESARIKPETDPLEMRHTKLQHQIIGKMKELDNCSPFYFRERKKLSEQLSVIWNESKVVSDQLARIKSTWLEVHRNAVAVEMDHHRLLCRHKRVSDALDRVGPRAEQREKKQQSKDALAAAHVGKTRNIAQAIRKQLAQSEFCPYCYGPLGSNFQADHIYPVRLGGLSTADNMVLVCWSCNQRKSDLTLREFAEKFGLDRGQIERALSQLSKRF